MAADKNITICEIFGPTVQGEGPLIGRPTIFVRTGGCDYRCVWCDSLFAVLPEYKAAWRQVSPQEILGEIQELSGNVPLPISLSGGNPALQGFGPLIRLGHAAGYTFLLETQGSVAQPWFSALDWLILSVKPPSSQMTTDWAALELCLSAARKGPQISLKVTVFDAPDYHFARALAERHPQYPLYLQIGNSSPARSGQGGPATLGAADLAVLTTRYDWLLKKLRQDRWYDVYLLPQLHVLLWGNKRGV